MARTLTAGINPEPRQQRQPADCADVVAGLWITLEGLWLLGRRYGKVLKAMQTTREKLQDPRLRDHPKRPAAEGRLEGWRLELRDLDAKAEGKRKAFERQWDGTPERIHRFLRDSGGWPEGGGDGKGMANGLWRQVIEGGPWPNGECPFALLVCLGITLRLVGLG